LVGPRPERPEFVPGLARAVPGYNDRHLVRPGVTGLAQVQLPPDTDLDSVRRKTAFDLHYIRHIGLWLDLRLVLCTALHMLGLPPCTGPPPPRPPSAPPSARRAPPSRRSSRRPGRAPATPPSPARWCCRRRNRVSDASQKRCGPDASPKRREPLRTHRSRNR